MSAEASLYGDQVALGYLPGNYTPTNPTIEGHAEGIDAALGSVSASLLYTPTTPTDWPTLNKPATVGEGLDNLALLLDVITPEAIARLEGVNPIDVTNGNLWHIYINKAYQAALKVRYKENFTYRISGQINVLSSRRSIGCNTIIKDMTDGAVNDIKRIDYNMVQYENDGHDMHFDGITLDGSNRGDGNGSHTGVAIMALNCNRISFKNGRVLEWAHSNTIGNGNGIRLDNCKNWDFDCEITQLNLTTGNGATGFLSWGAGTANGRLKAYGDTPGMKAFVAIDGGKHKNIKIDLRPDGQDVGFHNCVIGYSTQRCEYEVEVNGHAKNLVASGLYTQSSAWGVGFGAVDFSPVGAITTTTTSAVVDTLCYGSMGLKLNVTAITGVTVVAIVESRLTDNSDSDWIEAGRFTARTTTGNEILSFATERYARVRYVVTGTGSATLVCDGDPARLPAVDRGLDSMNYGVSIGDFTIENTSGGYSETFGRCGYVIGHCSTEVKSRLRIIRNGFDSNGVRRAFDSVGIMYPSTAQTPLRFVNNGFIEIKDPSAGAIILYHTDAAEFGTMRLYGHFAGVAVWNSDGSGNSSRGLRGLVRATDVETRTANPDDTMFQFATNVVSGPLPPGRLEVDRWSVYCSSPGSGNSGSVNKGQALGWAAVNKGGWWGGEVVGYSYADFGAVVRLSQGTDMAGDFVDTTNLRARNCTFGYFWYQGPSNFQFVTPIQGISLAYQVNTTTPNIHVLLRQNPQREVVFNAPGSAVFPTSDVGVHWDYGDMGYTLRYNSSPPWKVTGMAEAKIITPGQTGYVWSNVPLPNADATLTLAQGDERVMCSGTQTTGRTFHLSTAGAYTYKTWTFTKVDGSPHGIVFINDGPGGGTLLTQVAAAKIEFIFDVDWYINQIRDLH